MVATWESPPTEILSFKEILVRILSFKDNQLPVVVLCESVSPSLLDLEDKNDDQRRNLPTKDILYRILEVYTYVGRRTDYNTG